VLAEHVRVDPQGDGRVGVIEAGRDHMDGDSGEQQCGGVQMAQIVQPAWGSAAAGKRLTCCAG
jgi:hypothetical protein